MEDGLKIHQGRDTKAIPIDVKSDIAKSSLETPEHVTRRQPRDEYNEIQLKLYDLLGVDKTPIQMIEDYSETVDTLRVTITERALRYVQENINEVSPFGSILEQAVTAALEATVEYEGRKMNIFNSVGPVVVSGVDTYGELLGCVVRVEDTVDKGEKSAFMTASVVKALSAAFLKVAGPKKTGDMRDPENGRFLLENEYPFHNGASRGPIIIHGDEIWLGASGCIGNPEFIEKILGGNPTEDPWSFAGLMDTLICEYVRSYYGGGIWKELPDLTTSDPEFTLERDQ